MKWSNITAAVFIIMAYGMWYTGEHGLAYLTMLAAIAFGTLDES